MYACYSNAAAAWRWTVVGTFSAGPSRQQPPPEKFLYLELHLGSLNWKSRRWLPLAPPLPRRERERQERRREAPAAAMPLYQLGPMADVMSYVGQVSGGMLGASCSICLPDSNARRLLAACAKDVYAFEHDEGVSASLSYCPRSDRVQIRLGARGPNPHFCEWLRLEERQWENATRPDNVVQWGLYRILHGPHQGKAILAIRGTESARIKAVCSKGEGTSGPVTATWTTLVQDMDIGLGSGLLGLPIPWLGNQALIRQAIDHCVAAARKSGADFVCGHSLGGFLAECVCARTGVPGAAFNSPGPYTMGPTDCTGGAAFHGVPFEVHLTQLDPVSNFGLAGVPQWSHIGAPHKGSLTWHKGASHKMSVMLSRIGTLDDPNRECREDLADGHWLGGILPAVIDEWVVQPS